MGEAFGRWQLGPDEEIMKHIDVANVACGYHASDPVTLHKSKSNWFKEGRITSERGCGC